MLICHTLLQYLFRLPVCCLLLPVSLLFTLQNVFPWFHTKLIALTGIDAGRL